VAASDLATVAYIYKRMYSPDQVGDIAMRDHPLFSMVEKKGGFGGSAFFYGIRYGNPQGISGTFARAQARARSSKGVQLQAARRQKYGVITMNGEAMAAARGDKAAFLDLVTQETEGILEEFGDALAFDLHRNGTGNRGQRLSAAGNVITLVTPDDARNFKVGMGIVADDTADGSSPRVGTAEVTAVDEDAGTFTVDNVANITGFANNDFLFRDGDPGTCMEGLESLFPLAAPVFGVDSFRGIDRGQDPRRLAGVRINDPGTPLEENLGLIGVKISQVGKRGRIACINPIDFWVASRRLDAKVMYDDGGGEADYGFQYITIHSPAGSLKVYADADCPVNRKRVLNLDYLYIKHLDGLPHIVDDDGNPSLRMTSEDAVEARVRGWCNLVTTVPGANGVAA
jgi:hypothetical protein